MPARLVTLPPPATGVYRLAWDSAEPFASPDWERAYDDGTFGHRFDDPTAGDGRPTQERFRAIYCATQRVATFGETVARFRPSLSLLANLETVADDEPLDEALAGAVDPADPRRGLIRADWCPRRRMGHTMLDPSLVFVDITAAETIQHLRQPIAPLAMRLNLRDLDLSSLTSQQRRLTQEAARYIYDRRDPSGTPLYAGIRYLSRLEAAWECWALFDQRVRHQIGSPGAPKPVLPDDDDLISVARIFGLTIEILPGKGRYIRP